MKFTNSEGSESWKFNFVTFDQERLRNEVMTTTIISKIGQTKRITTAEALPNGSSGTAPSVRVLVTEENRAYLRFIRRAELEAW